MATTQNTVQVTKKNVHQFQFICNHDNSGNHHSNTCSYNAVAWCSVVLPFAMAASETTLAITSILSSSPIPSSTFPLGTLPPSSCDVFCSVLTISSDERSSSSKLTTRTATKKVTHFKYVSQYHTSGIQSRVEIEQIGYLDQVTAFDALQCKTSAKSGVCMRYLSGIHASTCTYEPRPQLRFCATAL